LGLIAGVTGSGYLVGSSAAPDEQEATSLRRQSARAALPGAYGKAFRQGLASGLAAGTAAGEMQARRDASRRGGDAGEIALRHAVEAQARAQAQEAEGGGGSAKGNVLVVGDSLEVLTSPYLQRYLPSVKFTINVKGGYSSIQLFRLFQESFNPSHDVIVFDAGTNDNPAYPQILASRLQAVARAVGDRCMVVPTIHGLSVDGVTSAAKNRVVMAFAASRPGTQVPDWASAAVSNPGILQPDNLHPTARGADLRAQLIDEGIAACLAFNSNFGAF
jgi:hypothetical protein